jgi:uncharacterized protein with HEPN domain
MKMGVQGDRVYLSHMLECIARVLEYCEGGEAAFKQSRLIQDAVIRNLQTMAESSQRLTEATKALAPQVPWRAIAGFRNIIVHDYLGVDPDMVWQVVVTDLPGLRDGLLAIEESEPGKSAA